MIGKPEEISLYFHIPFCTKKCDYCHFYVLPDKEESKEQLFRGFQLEWALLLPFLKNKKIVTIYFGGGTPSLFGATRIASLLRLIRGSCETDPLAEVTLEVNPENITLPLMQAYAESGINRVSIGVQTLKRELLITLGRLHDPFDAIQAVHTTKQAGIDNISIDLMYDLPAQTLQDWESTLQVLHSLPLTHLSLYNLTIEPQTIFFKKRKELTHLLPDETTSLAMITMAWDLIEKTGLIQYEISAFAKPGYRAKHNTGYWTGRSFFGLGPSAFSYWEQKRLRNIAHLNRYCKMLEEGLSPRDFEEQLDPDHMRRELFVIRLRLKEGVPLSVFTREHGPLEQETEILINQFIKEEFLFSDGDSIKLTKKGMLFYDTIATELI